MKSNKSIYFYNRHRAMIATLCSIAIAVMVFVGLMIRLFDTTVGYSKLSGMLIYRFFTVESNLLMGICALFSIPYQVDGIKNGNYHMPKWIVYLSYMGVTGVAMTFLVTLTIMSPVTGFHYIMIEGSGLYFHLLTPLLSMAAFIFINCDHRINFRVIWLAVAPVVLYGILYFVMVFLLGPEHGGWTDHYQIGERMPLPVAFVILMSAAFLIAFVLRIFHNKMHAREKNQIKKCIQEAVTAKASTIEDAIILLAKDDKKHDNGKSDVVVPRRVIIMIMEKYDTEKTLPELMKLYVDAYHM